MSATIAPYWPGIRGDQQEDHPGFHQDYHEYASWMVEVVQPLRFLARWNLRKLGAGALLTFKTDGVSDSDVDWVTPDELSQAAQSLERFVLDGHRATARVVRLYRKNCAEPERAAERFAQDLRDVRDLALWAKSQGARKLTLDINW